MEKDPSVRYHSIEDMVVDLRRTLKQSSRVPRPSSSSAIHRPAEATQQERSAVHVVPPKKNRSLLITGAALVLVALIAAGVWMFLPSDNKAFSSFEFSRITSTGGVRSAAISPDNRYICYSQYDKGQFSLWVRQLATSSNILIKPPQDLPLTDPVFSKDGNYIYYRHSEPGAAKMSLSRIPVLGGNSVKVIDDVDGPITFSPDGSKFAFNRVYMETGMFALVVASSDGSQQKDLVAYKGEKWISGIPSWSPHGDIIAVALGLWKDGFHHELIGVNAVNGEVKKMTDRRWDVISNAAWLTDGSGMIVEVREIDKMLTQLYFVAYPSGSARAITNDLNEYSGTSVTSDMRKICVVQSEREMYLSLVPDGDAKKVRKLTQIRDDGLSGIVAAADRTVYYSSRQNGNFDILSIHLETGEQRQITNDEFMESSLSLTPDGQTLLFSSARAGIPNLWRIGVNGSGLTQLTKGAEDYFPMMDASGNWIVFASWVRGPQTIMRIPAAGGDRIDVTTENGTSPVLSGDGNTVYFISLIGTKRYICEAPVTGGSSRRLYECPKDMTTGIVFRPGSQELSYVITKDGVSNIFLRPVNGGPERQFTHFDDQQIAFFNWTNDGRSVIVSRGMFRSDVVLLTDKTKE